MPSLPLQPGDNPPALKPWGFNPTVEVVQQPQVVFLQPVVSRQASAASKDSSTRHRRPKNYLPILKSYPKIAPHPGDGSSSSGRGTASLSSSVSSSSSGSEKGSSLTSNPREHCQRDKQQRGQCGAPASNFVSTTPSVPDSPSTISPLPQSRLLLHPTEAAASSSPSAVSQSELTLSVSHTSASRSETVPAPQVAAQASSSLVQPELSDSDDTKRKRFYNTYNILSKSGLLDIALRTKELHRQNRRTQTDLDQLKEHTELFLQALCSGDTSICLKLQTYLQEEDREKDGEKAGQASLKAD